MRLTYGKLIDLDNLDEQQRHQVGENLNERIRQLIQLRFQKNPLYQVHFEESNGISLSVTRGAFVGYAESLVGSDLIVVDGQSQRSTFLKVSADYENIATESAYEHSEEIRRKYKIIGIVTLGTLLAVITTMITVAARRVYPALIILMFAVGGGIGSMVGGMIGDKYFQEQAQSEQEDEEVNQAKTDWNAFIKDLMAEVENLSG